MGAALDTGNMGVSALATSVIQLIYHHCADAEVKLFIGNRSNAPQAAEVGGRRVLIPVVNFRNSPKARISEQMWFIFMLALIYRAVPVNLVRKMILKSNRWLRELASMDLVGEIRGGDSFSDIYGLWRFFEGCLPSIIALWVVPKVVLLPQTYGPFRTKLARVVARYILNHCRLMASRDKDSLRLLSGLLRGRGTPTRMLFCPDVAFTLEVRKPNHMAIQPPLPDLSRRILVGININGLMYNGGYTRRNMFNLKMDYRDFVFRMLKGLLEREHIHVLLVPHTFGPPGNINSDPDACGQALKAVSHNGSAGRIHMVTRQYNPSEMKAIIGQCDFFIGSRMHACIAALSQGIPTVGVAYSKKFKGVFESVGAGEGVVDARTVTGTQGAGIILERIGQMQKLPFIRLDEPMLAAKQQIVATFQQILYGNHA